MSFAVQLLSLGGILSVLFVLLAIIASREQVNPWMFVLGSLVIVAAAGSMIASVYIDPTIQMIAIGIAGAVFVASVAAGVTGRRAQGVQGGIAALATIAAIFLIPVAGDFTTDSGPALEDQIAQAQQAANLQGPLLVLNTSESDIAPLTATDSDTPASTAIPATITPTPFSYSLPTPIPVMCRGTVTTNTNFRESSVLSANILDVIPEGAVIEVTGQSGDWLEVEFNGQDGWVSGSLVDLDDDCTL